MVLPFMNIEFLEPPENNNEDIKLGVIFLVSPYRLYQLYVKATALFPDSGLPPLPAERIQDYWDFLSLSDQDIQLWLRNVQSERLLSFLRYMANPYIDERAFSNISFRASAMLRDDLKLRAVSAIEGEAAKAEFWEMLDQMQRDKTVFNWRGDLTRLDEADRYCLNFGCGCIALNGDEVVSFMKRHYPMLLELAEQGGN